MKHAYYKKKCVILNVTDSYIRSKLGEKRSF